MTRRMEHEGRRRQWWTDRRALDRKLAKLLIEIEEDWLGAFSHVIFPNQANDESLTDLSVMHDLFGMKHALIDVLCPGRMLPVKQLARITSVLNHVCGTSVEVSEFRRRLPQCLGVQPDTRLTVQHTEFENVFDDSSRSDCKTGRGCKKAFGAVLGQKRTVRSMGIDTESEGCSLMSGCPFFMQVQGCIKNIVPIGVRLLHTQSQRGLACHPTPSIPTPVILCHRSHTNASLPLTNRLCPQHPLPLPLLWTCRWGNVLQAGRDSGIESNEAWQLHG